MRLPVGQSDFAQIIKSDFEFVDKSLLIKDLMSDDQIILITRPRRFGKTLNLSMLRYFFMAEVDSKPTRPLFDQLEISKETAVCARYQGQHPVISFSFKDVKESSYQAVRSGIFDVITNLYHKHRYLLESEKLSEEEKAVYRSVLNQTAAEIKFKNSLKNLILYLREHYSTNVVVLIDEYDTPIQSGYLHGYYEEIMNFFRVFFAAALKDNECVLKAVLTGILRVAKENLFSGLNNLVSYSMLKQRYGTYFGFTEQEVESLLQAAGLEEQLSEVKRWYNGYKVMDETIYNPWSIASYLKEKQFQPYWVNTSDNGLLRDLLVKSNGAFREELEVLIKGGSIRHILDDDFVFTDLKTHNEATFWNLMFMSGYLKADSCKRTDWNPECNLSIPNQEIHGLYGKLVKDWVSGDRGFVWYRHFIEHLLDGNMELFSQDLSSIMEEVVSVHDTSKDPEAFYHGLVIGLTAGLHSDENYELRSNRESGKGRYDYFIISRDPNKFSILMEFKKTEAKKLKAAAKTALKQIKSKDYLVEAKQRGISKLLKIGIAFHGKEFAIQFQAAGS